MTAVKIKPHLTAHILSAEETVLLGENGRFALRGELYAALIPLLDGARDADALAEMLADRFPPERVYYALMQLEAMGHTGPANGPSEDAAASAWW